MLNRRRRSTSALRVGQFLTGNLLEGPRIEEQFQARDQVFLECQERCGAADPEGWAKVDIIVHHRLFFGTESYIHTEAVELGGEFRDGPKDRLLTAQFSQRAR